MEKNEITIFLQALQLLDDKLEEIQYSKIQIRAIGGFAMLYLGLKEHGYTIDIDSLTPNFDQAVVNVIHEVGIELKIDQDWLNTDCATLDGFLTELEPHICWQKSQFTFRHIELFIADNYGLIRSKAKAIHEGGLVPRKTDKKDLLLLLKMNNINNLKELDQLELLKFIDESYNRCYQYLKELNEW